MMLDSICEIDRRTNHKSAVVNPCNAEAKYISHVVWNLLLQYSEAPLILNPTTPRLRTIRSPRRLTKTPVRSANITFSPYDIPLVMLTRCGLFRPPAPSAFSALYMPGPQKKTPARTAAWNLVERVHGMVDDLGMFSPETACSSGSPCLPSSSTEESV